LHRRMAVSNPFAAALPPRQKAPDSKYESGIRINRSIEKTESRSTLVHVRILLNQQSLHFHHENFEFVSKKRFEQKIITDCILQIFVFLMSFILAICILFMVKIQTFLD
jgi:hypothetical protein